MKYTKTETYNIPDGDYCQKSDGSVTCAQYNYAIDPFSGAQFRCSLFDHYLDVPFDNKPIRANRDIKKCDKCKFLEMQ